MARREAPLNLINQYEYLVHWAGYPNEVDSWEPASHIPISLRAAFDAGVDHGRVSEAASIASAPCRELSADERVALTSTSECTGSLKETQSNTPKEGYLSRTWGMLLFARSCVLILDLEEVFVSESLSKVTYTLFRLFSECPKLLDEIEVMAYDDMCHWYKFMLLRADQYPEYAKVIEAIRVWVVDKSHFKTHNKNDTFCQTRCNPNDHEQLLSDQNSIACEQNNRWFSRFKVMMRPMTPSIFMFFALSMCTRRNVRTIIHAVESAPLEQLRRQLDAHGYEGLYPWGADLQAAERGARRHTRTPQEAETIAKARKMLIKALRPAEGTILGAAHARR
jgi:hypothetical protein